MSEVFLSYAREDKAKAKRLAELLAGHGWSVWWDRQIPAGKRYREIIDKALADARCIVVLWSKDAIESDWVLEEAEDGKERGILVPVLIENVQPPRGFRAVQTARLHLKSTHLSEELETLIHDIAQIVGPPTAGPAAAPVTVEPAEDMGLAASTEIGAATGLPQTRTNHVDGTELVLIPAGPFKVGSETQANNPPREMSLPAFYLARYPVTNAQYGEFLKANPQVKAPEYWDDERFNQPQQPVVGVSWEEARVYCEWAGLRLATEWEWEKGARGTDGRTYPWGEEEPDASRATFGDTNGQPTPVGSCPTGASPYGLLDMAGNVWEWTESIYKEGGVWRTVRGGSFSYRPQSLRAAYRSIDRPDYRYHTVGFRCAKDA